MLRASLVCLLTIALTACVSIPSSPLMPSTVQTATNVVIVATTTTPTAPPTTIVTVESSTPMPTLNPAQIVWSGSISPLVFRELMSEELGTREALQVPKSDTIFNVFARPIIIAAYVYESPSDGQRHARFLLYERGGKWEDKVVSPFLYKMDLPLSRIAGHEDYGNYDQLIMGLQAQFESPISPNKLSIGVFSEKYCANTDDVQQQLCAELAKQNIELPVDYETAKAMVMDQWDLAVHLTATQVGDIEQAVERLNAGGTTWWEDNRFILFYLPHVTVCLPGGGKPLCGTYISYEMRVDTFGLLGQ